MNTSSCFIHFYAPLGLYEKIARKLYNKSIRAEPTDLVAM